MDLPCSSCDSSHLLLKPKHDDSWFSHKISKHSMVHIISELAKCYLIHEIDLHIFTGDGKTTMSFSLPSSLPLRLWAPAWCSLCYLSDWISSIASQQWFYVLIPVFGRLEYRVFFSFISNVYFLSRLVLVLTPDWYNLYTWRIPIQYKLDYSTIDCITHKFLKFECIAVSIIPLWNLGVIWSSFNGSLWKLDYITTFWHESGDIIEFMLYIETLWSHYHDSRL